MKKKPDSSNKAGITHPGSQGSAIGKHSLSPSPEHDPQGSWRDLLEKTNDWVWTMDQRGCFTYSSSSVHHLLGYTPQELIGKKARQFVAIENTAEWDNLLSIPERKNFPLLVFHMHYKHQSGNLLLMENQILPVRNPRGELLRYRGTSKILSSGILSDDAVSVESSRRTLDRDSKSYSRKDICHLINPSCHLWLTPPLARAREPGPSTRIP